MRKIALLLLAAGMVQGAELPAWWAALLQQPRLESEFTQISESAVFGHLKKAGLIQLDSGGRLRVSYVKGVTLVSDGKTLVQYDPSARTAQRMDLRSAVRDMPLLNVLVDPRALEASYSIRVEAPERLQLEPRRKDLPAVQAQGENGFLKRISWTDPTGAQQSVELKAPRTPKEKWPPATFTFTPPAGTRWIR